MIKNLLTYVTLATVLLKLNKTLDADAKALFGEMHCLVYRIKNVMEDQKVTNAELDDLASHISEVSTALVTLLENFTIPEEGAKK